MGWPGLLMMLQMGGGLLLLCRGEAARAWLVGKVGRWDFWASGRQMGGWQVRLGRGRCRVPEKKAGGTRRTGRHLFML
jgi:hypothetical protein